MRRLIETQGLTSIWRSMETRLSQSGDQYKSNSFFNDNLLAFNHQQEKCFQTVTI